MTAEDYREFGKIVGIPIKTKKFLRMMAHLIQTMNILQHINTAIVKRMDLLEYYDSRQNILDIERDTLYLLSEELKRYKKEKGLKDFTDLLENFYCTRKQINLKLCL